MSGQCLATPDVCNTPSPVGPVPIPYVNVAQMMMAVQTSTKVFVMNMPAVHLGSKIPISSGNEAGNAPGGVVSGVFISETSFSKGSINVLVEGKPWVHLTSMTRQNGVSCNMPCGQVVAPSQSVVLVAP
jgi:hypothetical protein